MAIALLVLVASACSRGGDLDATTVPGGAETTTTTAGPGVGPGTGGGDTTTTESTTTTTTVPLVELTHEIRIQGQGSQGVILVIQVPGGVATDRALEDLFVDLVDQYAPVQRMHVVDSLDAAELVLRDPTTLTEDEQAVLDAHHLLSYLDNTVTFEGPFADIEGFVYGS
jgi:hypothetical protein